MLKQVSYLELAKEAQSRGDRKGVWRAFKQHARVMKKKRQRQRALHATEGRLIKTMM